MALMTGIQVGMNIVWHWKLRVSQNFYSGKFICTDYCISRKSLEKESWRWSFEATIRQISIQGRPTKGDGGNSAGTHVKKNERNDKNCWKSKWGSRPISNGPLQTINVPTMQISAKQTGILRWIQRKKLQPATFVPLASLVCSDRSFESFSWSRQRQRVSDWMRWRNSCLLIGCVDVIVSTRGACVFAAIIECLEI